jgi:hypothetical protein
MSRLGLAPQSRTARTWRTSCTRAQAHSASSPGRTLPAPPGWPARAYPAAPIHVDQHTHPYSPGAPPCRPPNTSVPSDALERSTAFASTSAFGVYVVLRVPRVESARIVCVVAGREHDAPARAAPTAVFSALRATSGHSLCRRVRKGRAAVRLVRDDEPLHWATRVETLASTYRARSRFFPHICGQLTPAQAFHSLRRLPLASLEALSFSPTATSLRPTSPLTLPAPRPASACPRQRAAAQGHTRHGALATLLRSGLLQRNPDH